MSKQVPDVDSFHRIELITGNGRRRRWPDKVKEAIIAETLEEGAVVSEIARRHRVASSQIFTWRKNARERAFALAAETAVFAPVVMEHQPIQASSLAQPFLSPMIEIEIHGAKLRLPANASREAIFAVIEAVGGLPSLSVQHEASRKRRR